jgi:DNA-directed RNA polymerase specialized sigma24 family protein
MSTPFVRDLETYNRFILRIQDRAYTLAVYLTGADHLAERILQEVIRDSFAAWQRSNPETQDFEPRLLRSLLQRCRHAAPVLGPPDLHGPFHVLTCDEKLALILVDCLACSSQEAAQILAWPLPQLRRILTAARLKIAPRLPASVFSC